MQFCPGGTFNVNNIVLVVLKDSQLAHSHKSTLIQPRFLQVTLLHLSPLLSSCIITLSFFAIHSQVISSVSSNTGKMLSNISILL